jgi:hypothetical protein
VLQVGGAEITREALLQHRSDLANWQVRQLAIWACAFGADRDTLSVWQELSKAQIWSSDSILGLRNGGQHNWRLQSAGEIQQAPVLPTREKQLRTWPHQLMAIRHLLNNSNAFLGNEYIEIGINANGYFGADASDGISDGSTDVGTPLAPGVLEAAGFYGRQAGINTGIGLIGDANGFATSPDLSVDYFMPGTEEERWGISWEIGGTPGYYSQGGPASVGGAFSGSTGYQLQDLSTGTTAKAAVSGTLANGLKITLTYTLEDGQK